MAPTAPSGLQHVQVRSFTPSSPPPHSLLLSNPAAAPPSLSPRCQAFLGSQAQHTRVVGGVHAACGDCWSPAATRRRTSRRRCSTQQAALCRACPALRSLCPCSPSRASGRRRLLSTTSSTASACRPTSSSATLPSVRPGPPSCVHAHVPGACPCAAATAFSAFLWSHLTGRREVRVHSCLLRCLFLRHATGERGCRGVRPRRRHVAPVGAAE